MNVDRSKAYAFLDTILGWENLGVRRDGEEVCRPNAPLARAHLEAVLGDKCPNYGMHLDGGRGPALAAHLRAVADAIDPPAA